MQKPSHSDAKHPVCDNRQKPIPGFFLMLRERIMFSAPALRQRNLRIADFYQPGF